MCTRSRRLCDGDDACQSQITEPSETKMERRNTDRLVVVALSRLLGKERTKRNKRTKCQQRKFHPPMANHALENHACPVTAVTRTWPPSWLPWPVQPQRARSAFSSHVGKKTRLRPWDSPAPWVSFVGGRGGENGTPCRRDVLAVEANESGISGASG